MRSLFAAILAAGVLSLAALAPAQLPAPTPQLPPALAKLKLKVLPVPNDAVVLADRHILTVPKPFRPFIRYVWVPDHSQENFQSTLLALGYISRSVFLTPPREYV